MLRVFGGAWCALALAFFGFWAGPLPAEEEGDPSRLTLARIYASRDFDTDRFSARWMESEDGPAGYTTLEESPDVDGKDIVRFGADDGERSVLVSASHLVPPGESKPLAIDGYAWSPDRAKVLIYTNSRRVWRRKTRGDYWVLDRSSRELHRLGGDAPAATLMFAKFSPDGRSVGYVREGNVYLEKLADHSITQLTTSESSDVINGTFDWVYEEELRLRDGFRFSPDGSSIAFWQIDASDVEEFVLVNNTDGLYPKLTRFAYPKVGEKNPACRIGVVDLATQNTRWLEIPGDPRNHYLARMEWLEGTHMLLVQQLNRLQNKNQLWLADSRSGAAFPLLAETDEAWVNVHDELHWLNENRFTWISERDGWRHVYLAGRDGELTLATPGEFDVIELLSADEDWLYYLASPDNPTQRYLFRCRLNGGDQQQLTPDDQPGTHAYRLSPDGNWALHTYSAFDTPPVTDLVSLPDHRSVRTLAANKKLHENFEKLDRQPAEFFRVPIAEGVELDGWCLKPPDLDETKKYPLLVYVYGEPAGQTVLDRWGGDGFLWHLMLAQRGYVVMSFDNRGTPAPRGRDWRKIVYRRVGVLAPRDQAAAVKRVLAERPYLDADRVGVWGWSGGGSMTLNAIFKYPQLYHVGISIAPVSNQRYYDTIYQERYMGLPSDNVDGFLEGSPINFAKQLEGDLLLIHGTGDDNCHYQGTEALINELIRHNKRFSMMAYPNRSHSIREGKNTTLHLRTLMTSYLDDHLIPGPQP